MGVAENIKRIKEELGPDVDLVAVSKYSADELVQEAYDAGHRDFGENKAQDVQARKERFPEDVRWHFIGHLQRNKVKYIAPFVHLIHSVDSPRLLKEINKQAEKVDRTIDVLLQVHIAAEESKFGLSEEGLLEMLESEAIQELKNVRITGLMGMATNTDDEKMISQEFDKLNRIYKELSSNTSLSILDMKTLSMGMSNDYKIALSHGTTMVRIGSAVFND
jgi:pyridoxal phosphate enzyme (YggS family)